MRFGQQGKKIRPCYLCPRGSHGGQTLAHLHDSLLSLPLHGQRPAPQDRSPRQPVWKPLLAHERNLRLCPFLDCLPLSAVLMEHARPVQGKCQGKGVSQLPGQGERLVASLEGSVWIAKVPQGQGWLGEARHPNVDPLPSRAGLVRIGERHPSLKVCSG